MIPYTTVLEAVNERFPIRLEMRAWYDFDAGATVIAIEQEVGGKPYGWADLVREIEDLPRVLDGAVLAFERARKRASTDAVNDAGSALEAGLPPP